MNSTTNTARKFVFALKTLWFPSHVLMVNVQDDAITASDVADDAITANRVATKLLLD